LPLANSSFTEKAWRLSPMYLLYFTLFGVFVPYIARFLTVNGLTEQEASTIIAVVNGVNVFAPFLFSVLADRSGRRLFYIRLGYVGMGVFYLLALAGSGFWYYLTVFGLFGVFLSAVLPQMEAITLAILGQERSRYGQIRFWGSLGFVAVVWALGFLLDTYSVAILPIAGGVLSLLMFLSTFLIPEQKKSLVPTRPKIETAHSSLPIDRPQIAILLAVILFWQIGMAPYNTFFDLFLRLQGFSTTSIGFLISFGAVCEIAIFIYISRLFTHFSERHLMSFALLLTVFRWLILSRFADSFVIVLLSQTLHAVTFGMVHSVAVHRIGHLFPAHKASLGQGMYVAFGSGAGLFIGNLLAGWLWQGTGLIYQQAAIWSLLALLLTWFGFKDQDTVSARLSAAALKPKL
jgi:PPP family 3-phenylpropionic acid transporter